MNTKSGTCHNIGFTPKMPVSSPVVVHVITVMDNMYMGQVPLQAFQFSPALYAAVIKD